MAIIPINGSPFLHSLDTPSLNEAMQKIQSAQQVTRQLAKSLKTSVESGDPEEIAAATNSYLSSQDVMLACAVAANADLKPAKRRALEVCLAVPFQLNVFEPIKEKVHIFAQPKFGGGFRVVQDFGLMHRTAQQMVRRVLSAHIKPKPFQYSSGVGPPKAIKAVRTFVAQGYVYAAHLDIADHYGSFELEKLIEILPLPPGVVRNTVSGRYAEHVANKRKHGPKVNEQKGPYGPDAQEKPSVFSPPIQLLLTQARLGVPQGSGCSPIVAEFCMSRLAFAHDEVVVSNYADNFLLLAKSKDALKATEGELIEAVKELPGGSFKLVVKDRKALHEGITFLGHRLQIKEGDLRVAPSDGSEERLAARLIPMEMKLQPMMVIGQPQDMALVKESLSRIYSVIDGWRSAYRACDNIERYVEPYLLQFDALLSTFGMAVEEIKKHVTPDMAFTPSMSSSAQVH